MARKSLIVNADDYHSNRERNRGILRAAEEGIVTSVSVIANGPWEQEEVSQLKSTMGDRIGVHLNLTKGTPLVKNGPTLVDREGCFFSRDQAWYRACRGGFDLGELEAEFAAQIGRLRKMGLFLDHLDGNNHIHVFPGIAELVARLARDYGIPKVRLPWESFSAWQDWLKTSAMKKIYFRRLCRRARVVFQKYNLKFPDRLGGIQFPVVAQLGSLRAFLSTLPEGTTELMCHPGYPNPQVGGFSSIAREREMMALLDPRVRKDIQRFNIRLISYQDI